MDRQKIFTQNPDAEQWSRIKQYSYIDNIKKYARANNISIGNKECLEAISGSIIQAEEYFKAANNSSFHIAPLLYYYGSTNLMYSVLGLSSQEKPIIKNHGLKLHIPEGKHRIADICVQIVDVGCGAFSVINRDLFNSQTDLGGIQFKLLDVIGSIPELLSDFLVCYEDGLNYSIPINKLVRKKEYSYRAKIRDLDRWNNQSEAIEMIEGLKSNFLNPLVTGQDQYIVFRNRIDGKDISYSSRSGQKSFQISHDHGNRKISLHPFMYVFISLFALGYISRYRPDIWTPFVRQDSSGERHILEKLVTLADYYAPWIALSYIYRKEIRFESLSEGEIDLTHMDLKEELHEVVQKELSDMIRKKT